MGWFASIGVGLLAGVTGFITAFLVATAAIEWFRVPQREGAAAFVGMGVALLAFLLSVALGIACARHIAASQSPSFLKAWGLASAIIVALGLAVLVVMWLLADLPPKWQGRRLELAIELRCPPGFTPPALKDPWEAYASVLRLPSGDRSSWSPMQFDQGRMEAANLIVPALLDLETSAPKKVVSIRMGKAAEVVFPLEFGAKPTEKDRQWSPWIEATTPAGASHLSFSMRYRVQQEALPARELTAEELEAEQQAKIEAEYQALAPNAPLAEWLRFTRYGTPERWQRAAAATIRARPGFAQEMTDAILGEDLEAATETLRSFPHFAEPPIELAAALVRVGEDIAAELRALHELAPGDLARDTSAANISRKFSAWMEAVRALQGRDGTSFVPQLQEIATLSRKQPISHVISIDVRRVASYYLHTWAGIAPLPEDPPPR